MDWASQILILQLFCTIFSVKFVYSDLPPLKPAKLTSKQFVLPPCKACTVFVESFNEEFEKTSRGKHDGGDAAWEETKLQSYSKSELRLTEIQENWCKKGKHSDQCHALAEKIEHAIEDWWFNKQEEHQDLHKWLCIQELSVCCPPNHYGPKCNECPDCSGNGKCKGNGTRRGNGQCACFDGYGGPNCIECANGYYESFRDEQQLLCSKCHVACDAEHGCTGAGPKSCTVCNNGWVMNEDLHICGDVDECVALREACTPNQFCVNNEGSYSCLECDRACDGCHGDGPDLCHKCGSGYEMRGGICIDLASEKRDTANSSTRYIVYLGLCVATCVIFQSSTWIAAGIGILVASYITLSEYWLQTQPSPIIPSDKAAELFNDIFK